MHWPRINVCFIAGDGSVHVERNLSPPFTPLPPDPTRTSRKFQKGLSPARWRHRRGGIPMAQAYSYAYLDQWAGRLSPFKPAPSSRSPSRRSFMGRSLGAGSLATCPISRRGCRRSNIIQDARGGGKAQHRRSTLGYKNAILLRYHCS